MAEKLEAMARLGMANSRMKDFHDVWFVTHRFELDGPTLRRAIEATFNRRQTPVPEWPEPLGDAFARHAEKQSQWAAFIRRNGLSGLPARFSDLVVAVRDRLAPVMLGE